jgi:DNA repair exonuclease SbcCD ATPase subunit
VIRLDRLYIDNFKALRQVGLCFPAQCSVLVEGLNESGKSTLFEAVYFALYGRPLVSEAGHDSVIRYGAEAAFVELALHVDATELLVRRYLQRGRPIRARLLVRRPDGTQEEITRVAAVTRRLIAELGGLDGETLLHSCFVEQKKLQRLEGLDATARRHALLRLLNLDALAALETRFKPSPADDAAVREADARRELARLREILPARAAAARAAAARLLARRVREALARRATIEDDLARWAAERERLAAGRAALEARVQRGGRLDAAASALDTVAHALERVVQARAATVDARRACEEARHTASVTLPALEAEAAALEGLRATLDALTAGEAALAALDAAARAHAEHARLAAQLAALEAEAAAVAAALADAEALRSAGDQAGRCRTVTEQLAQCLDARAAAETALDAARAETAARARLAALEAAAERLAGAQAAEQAAAEAVARVDALAAAAAAATSAQANRAAAARALEEAALAVQAAEDDLARAQAATGAQRAPLLTTWIEAHDALEQGQRAEAARRAHAAARERLHAELVAAHAAASSAGRRAALCGAGALVAGLVAAALAAAGLLAPAAGLLLAAAALAVGAVSAGRRARAARATADALDRRAAALERELAGLDATIAAHASARARLFAAEQSLRALGEPLPDSVEAARARLAAAPAVPDRARAEEAVRRLRQRHTELAIALARAEAAERRARAELEAARAALDACWPPLSRPDADPAMLGQYARARYRQAQAARAEAQREADALLPGATPEGLRLAAATLTAEVRRLAERAAALPTLAERARAATAQAERLGAELAVELAALETALGRLPPSGEPWSWAGAVPPTDAAAARALVEALREFEARLTARLAALDPPVLTRAQTERAARLGSLRAQLDQQRAARDNALATARAHLAAAEPLGVGDASGTLGGEQCESLRRAVAAYRAQCDEQARRLGVAPTTRAVQEALARLEVERAQAAAVTRRVPELAAALAVAEQTEATAAAARDAAWARARAALAELSAEDRPAALGAPDAAAPPAADEATGARVRALAAALRERLLALDLDGARRELAEIARAQGQAQAALEHLEQARADATARLASLLAEVGLAADAPLAAVRAALPALDDPTLPEAETLERERVALLTELGALRARAEAVEAEWRLAGVALDLAACEAAYAAAVRQRAVKQQATRIVARARVALVERVLPSTEYNLRLLLPQLTAQRYHDAQLSEDYRLSVWDAEAGRFVAKEIFSGGAKDQFSLALRLAFALATLPQERGTAPGFIFLDEPLSAFDRPRTEALIALLTEGYIARSFAQIFLVSHSRAFDPGRFTHYLRLHEGAVAETTLARYISD